MKRNAYIVLLALVGCCLLAPASPVSAADAGGIKARMLDRLPVIDDYKARGIVGEDNQGFLQVMGVAGEWSEVVAAENRDRQMVYQAIAAKTGAPVETVGRRRALQIREGAVPGTWLQGDDGQWYKK